MAFCGKIEGMKCGIWTLIWSICTPIQQSSPRKSNKDFRGLLYAFGRAYFTFMLTGAL